MEEETHQELLAHRKLLEQILESTEKTRKYTLAMVIVSVAMVAIPLVALAVLVPIIINALAGGMNGLL